MFGSVQRNSNSSLSCLLTLKKIALYGSNSKITVADMIMKRMEKTGTSIITPIRPAEDGILGDGDEVDGSRLANRVVKSLREKTSRMTQVADTDVEEEVEVAEEDEGAEVAGAGEERTEMKAKVINV